MKQYDLNDWAMLLTACSLFILVNVVSVFLIFAVLNMKDGVNKPKEHEIHLHLGDDLKIDDIKRTSQE